MNVPFVALLAALGASPAPVPSSPTAPLVRPVQTEAPTVLEVLKGTGQHTVLTRLLTQAELVDALHGGQELTVFAPTDAAFRVLEQRRRGTLAMLAKPENRAMLRRVLSQHVVDGALRMEDVKKLKHATTLAGQRVDVTLERGKPLKVDEAKIERADVPCANGVVHVVDRLLMPESANALDVLERSGEFTTFLALVETAGLTKELAEGGPHTIFAPTDAAFATMPKGAVERLKIPGNKRLLVTLIQNHVVEGRIYEDQAEKIDKVATRAGRQLAVDVDLGEKRRTIHGVRILRTDEEASNGVLHVVDAVLLPR